MSVLIRSLNKINLYSKRNYAEVVNVYGKRTVETTGNLEKDINRPISRIPETAEKVAVLSGHPDEQLAKRRAIIYIAAKNSMQSGTYQLRKWRIEYDNEERWENPLIGWGSSADPLSCLQIEFPSKEDCIVYCERMGIEYEINEPQEIKKRIKSYGANFSWNKKTRRSTK